MKCDSRVEKSCLSFEEFIECPFSGKYLVCCSEAKQLQPPSNSSQLDRKMLYLRVKILLYLADFFQSIAINEEIVDLVLKEHSNSPQNKIKQPRHIYQKFSPPSKHSNE